MEKSKKSNELHGSSRDSLWDSRLFLKITYMVGETGVEPARVLPHNDLNVARIPFRHSPLYLKTFALYQLIWCQRRDLNPHPREGTAF